MARQKQPLEKTNEAQRRYRDRMASRGLVAVTEWVPFDDRDQLKQVADDMRKKAGVSTRKNGGCL